MIVAAFTSSVYWTLTPSDSITRICVLSEGERFIVFVVITIPEEISTEDASKPELNTAR